MDDLKVIIKSMEEAVKAHNLVKGLFNSLGLEINIKKSG